MKKKTKMILVTVTLAIFGSVKNYAQNSLQSLKM